MSTSVERLAEGALRHGPSPASGLHALPAPAAESDWAPAPAGSRDSTLRAALDRAGAGLLLLATSPLVAAIALAVRLSSRGPVLFAQTRTGLSGKPFRMLKFRSMVEGAEGHESDLARAGHGSGGPFFKVHADARVTRLGRVLRRTSLDELPQLVNVLRGEMSLVGPRPLLLREDARLPDEVRQWRYSVKPGLTGLWQVSGRSRTTTASRLRLDRIYVRNASLATDLKILARTPAAVLRVDDAV